MHALAVTLLALAVPSRPVLKAPPLPVKIAGGLFLFATSVPAAEKQRSADLQRLAQSALRNDPRVTMELGPGIEAGGVFASAATPDALCLNFQVQGGNAWAECNAFAAKTGDGLELVDLEIRMMDGASLSVDLRPRDAAAGAPPPPPPSRTSGASMSAAARSRAPRMAAAAAADARRSSPGASGAAARELLLSRRTINDFEPELPADWEEALVRAVEAATFAPNHKRTEPWRFHLLGPEAVSRVCALNAELVAASKGDAAGAKKLKRWLAMPGWLVVTCVGDGDGASMDDPSGVGREDYAACCCAVQNLCLALHADGLGTKWTSGPVNFDARFNEACGIPEDQFVVGTIWFGAAAGAPPPPPKKKLALDEVMVKHA